MTVFASLAVNSPSCDSVCEPRFQHVSAAPKVEHDQASSAAILVALQPTPKHSGRDNQEIVCTSLPEHRGVGRP